MKVNFILIIAFLIIQATYTQQKIEITFERNDDNSVDFFYKKNLPGSYYLIVDFERLENCNDGQIFEKVIRNKSGSLFTLKPIDEKKYISFSYRTKYSIGNPNPKIDDDITYLLPFKRDKTVKITEATDAGKKYFGSEERIDWKSFIIYSKKPDTIYAMRRGKVISLTNKHDKSEQIISYTTNRNKVIIEHEDGTYALYEGFNKDQIFVNLGQDVYPHTSLGTLDEFNTNNYRLDFNIFHFLSNLLDEKKSTLKDRNNKIKYLNPNFFVDGEHKKIEARKTYTVSYSKEIKLKEFPRREKRKYKKNPNAFN